MDYPFSKLSENALLDIQDNFPRISIIYINEHQIDSVTGPKFIQQN